ncbi:hypothetical protein NXV20_24270 [Bacteroides thetaiotaomicron]|nr:hypothetical protein [Bacteroides thetaiotaomicron]MCS2829290.1 hypothetical protein [Bacteroides thetaiotaomicron]
MKEWKGAKAGDFDYLGYFIKKGTNWGWRYTLIECILCRTQLF